MVWSREAEFKSSLATLGPQLMSTGPSFPVSYMRAWVEALVEARQQGEISEDESRARLQLLTLALKEHGVDRKEVHHFAEAHLSVPSDAVEREH